MSDDNLFDTSKGLSPTDLVSVQGAAVDPGDLRRRIKDATPEELNEFEEACITSMSPSILLLVEAERRARTESGLRVIADMRHSEIIDRLEVLARPHWTMTPGFWLIVASALLSALALWLGWLQFSESASPDSAHPASSISTPQQPTPQP